MVIVPADDMMNKAMELDMPPLNIIEQPIKPMKKGEKKKKYTTSIVTSKGGTIELQTQMHKDSF